MEQTLKNKNIGGLSSREARIRSQKFGRNIIGHEGRANPIVDFLKKFSRGRFLVLILIFASAVSFFLGEQTNALIILFLIFISISLDFINAYQSKKAFDKLIAQVKTTATVIRDGEKKEINLEEIVPYDLVLLSPGDIVPADCKILESDGLFVDQSALTGESFPVLKDAKIEQNFVFMGTSVVGGTAKVLVIKIGNQTEFGKIALKLFEAAPETDFEKGIRGFSFFILKTVLIMVGFVFLVNSLLGRGVFESFIFAVAIAIGLTPELLPVIMSIALSRGSIEMAKKSVIVKNLSTIHNFGSMNVLCMDKTGTLTQNKITLIKYLDGLGAKSDKTLLYSYLSSFFHTGIKNPFDQAIREFKKIDASEYKKNNEIPFDFANKRDSIIVERDKDRFLITKGAPEKILEISKFYFDGNKKKNLTAAALKKIQNTFKKLSNDGLRTLGVATKKIGKEKIDLDKKNQKNLIFLGFIAFLDPPKEDAEEAISELEKYGVEIKILTGDAAVLTEKICRKIGVVYKGIISGEDLEKLSEPELKKIIEQTTIFARISPEQKEKIILTLKKMNNVVGYLGDGINDAPALKAADVGISVNNAVDVAKETAGIILLHKSLEVLKDGVVEGRKTFQNTLKYIMIGLSSNFGNMFSMVGTSLFLPFLPMLPSQILLNNLIYEISQFSLSADSVDADVILKPTEWNLGFIKKFMLIFGPVSSLFDFIIFGVLLLVFHFSQSQFQTGWFMESIATQILVIFIIRTKIIPFFKSRPGMLVMLNSLAAFFIAWLIPFSPFGKLFKFESLSLGPILSIVAIVILYLVLAELAKKYFYVNIKISKI